MNKTQKMTEKMQWAKAGVETLAQNITALASTTRGKALGIAAAASLAACSKEDDPMPESQPTTTANTITVLQNPPATVSGAVGDTLPFFHGKYRALKGDIAVNVQETEDPNNAIRILAHPHPDSTNVAFDTAGTAKMEVTASSARQVEGDTTFSAEEMIKEITGQGLEPEPEPEPILNTEKINEIQAQLNNLTVGQEGLELYDEDFFNVPREAFGSNYENINFLGSLSQDYFDIKLLDDAEKGQGIKITPKLENWFTNYIYGIEYTDPATGKKHTVSFVIPQIRPSAEKATFEALLTNFSNTSLQIEDFMPLSATRPSKNPKKIWFNHYETLDAAEKQKRDRFVEVLNELWGNVSRVNTKDESTHDSFTGTREEVAELYNYNFDVAGQIGGLGEYGAEGQIIGPDRGGINEGGFGVQILGAGDSSWAQELWGALGIGAGEGGTDRSNITNSTAPLPNQRNMAAAIVKRNLEMIVPGITPAEILETLRANPHLLLEAYQEAGNVVENLRQKWGLEAGAGE